MTNEREPATPGEGAVASEYQDNLEYMRQREQQLADIEKETKQKPLVGDKIDFAAIIAEYNPETSKEFLDKAEDLGHTYEFVRPIRGDGNCFYRAVIVAQLERITSDPSEFKRFDQVCRSWLPRFLKLKFSDVTTEDFCTFFYEKLDKIKNHELSLQDIIKELNEDSVSNYYVMFARLVASGFLKENAELYAPFVDNGQDLFTFCEHEIESMWKDVDHLAILGLVNGLGLSIRVEYLDRSQSPSGKHYDVPEDPIEEPPIVLLYRPGHYDLIYRKKP